jgi:hypothetical protein
MIHSIDAVSCLSAENCGRVVCGYRFNPTTFEGTPQAERLRETEVK